MSLNATDREIVEDLFAIINEWKPVVQAHQRDEVDDRVIFTDMAGVKHNATVDWLRDNWLKERDAEKEVGLEEAIEQAEERIRKLETSAPDCAALLKQLKAAETNIATLKQQLNLSIQYRQGVYDRAKAELDAGRLSPNQYRVVIANMPPIKDGEKMADGTLFVDTDAILRDKAASWDLHNEGLRMAKLPPLPTVRELERKALSGNGGTLKMANGRTLTFADWQFVPAPGWLKETVKGDSKAPSLKPGDKVRLKPGPYLDRYMVGADVVLTVYSAGDTMACCSWDDGRCAQNFEMAHLAKVAEEKTTASPVACCAAGKPFLTGQWVVYVAYPNEFKGAGEIVQLGGGSVCVKWNVGNGETRKVWHMPSKLKRA